MVPHGPPSHSRAFLILKSFTSNDPKLLLRAYIVYVRPLLESCSQVWSPYLKKDIICIERVQKYFTRHVCFRAGILFTDYSDRLRLLCLESLELRRLKFDMHMVYKIIHGLVDLPIDEFFTFYDSKYETRGHSFKLKNNSFCRYQFRKYFFSVRVLPIWNSLPANVVNASSLCVFKARLNNVTLCNFLTS